MVFNGIKEAFSSITTRFSSPKPFTTPYTSSELPPSGPPRSFGFSSSKYKNSLRLSSSLQDFSKYNQLDPEEGNLNPQLSRENNVSSFSKDKSPPRATVKRKWARPATVLLCFLVLTCIIYGFLHLYSNWSHQSTRYFVVLDCGSTGTRVFVYQASINRQKTANLPILLKSLPEDIQSKPSSQSGRAYNRMETEPGFDKLVNNVTGLTRAINPLLNSAEKQIPKHAHKTTSLFLYATAGVRRLPTADSDWLLTNAWLIMKRSRFVCEREWVKIISGTEEAYYGWIALNYHTHMLGANPEKQTYGALDLGGSSLQVTFENRDRANNETSLDLNIGPVSHRLSGYSLSGYGLNDAFDKSVVSLLKSTRDFSKPVKHPCLQSGYNENYNCPMCQSVFQDEKNPKPGIRVRLIGAPNWEECNKLARISVNLSEWSNKSQPIDCKLNPCALQDKLPRPRGQFYAMSGFFVVYRFFNLSGDAPLDEVLKHGQEFCEKTWDVAKVSVPAQPFIEQYCFRAPYVVLLLREGLHIKDSQVNIGSGGITWTTGVALLEGGRVISTKVKGHNYNYQVFQIEIHPFTLSAILVASLGLLVCALTRVSRCVPRLFHRHRNASGASVLNISSPFNSRRWSPIISGEGRIKAPLSPVARVQKRPFGNDIQIAESALYTSSSSNSSSITHSISSSNLGQMQFDSAFYPAPHRSQMRLQSRRSQSREDLISSLPDPTHI